MIFDELKTGISLEGQEIKSYRTDMKATHYVYFISGLHGNEVEGVFLVNRILEWLKSDHNILDVPLVITPIVNIDGYCQTRKENSHQVDLDKNFPSPAWNNLQKSKDSNYCQGENALSEPESVYLDGLFKKYPPAFVIIFSSGKPGVFYEGAVKDLANFIAKQNSYEVSCYAEKKNPSGLAAYLLHQYDTPSIIFQAPKISDDLSLHDIWQQNEKPFKQLFTKAFLLSKLENVSSK